MATEVHSIILNAAELHNVSGHGKIITLEVTMRESNGGGKERERRERIVSWSEKESCLQNEV